eukprot:Colp12_sorted_trinity150504_noHs@11842
MSRKNTGENRPLLSDSQPTEGDVKTVPPLKKIVVFFAATAAFLDYVLLTIVIPILPDYLENELKISKTLIGVLFSAKPALQLLASPLAGYSTDKYGPRYNYMFGLLLSGGSNIIFIFGDSYGLLLAARAIQGLGSSFLITSANTAVTLVHTDENRGKGLGLVMAGIASGVLVGPPIGSALYGTLGRHWPFLILSGLAGLLFLCFLPFSSRFPSFVKNVYSGFKKVDEAGDEKEEEDQPRSVSFSKYFELLGDPYVLIVSLSLLFCDGSIAALEPIIPIWLESEYNVDSKLTGLVFAASTLAYAITTPFVGAFGARFKRWRFICLGLLVMGLGLLAISVAPNLGLEIGSLALCGISIGFVDGAAMPLLATIADRRHPEATGRVFSIANMMLSLGFMSGPLLGNGLWDALDRLLWVMVVFAGLNVGFAPFLAFVRKFEQAPKEVRSV